MQNAGIIRSVCRKVRTSGKGIANHQQKYSEFFSPHPVLLLHLVCSGILVAKKHLTFHHPVLQTDS